MNGDAKRRTSQLSCLTDDAPGYQFERVLDSSNWHYSRHRPAAAWLWKVIYRRPGLVPKWLPPMANGYDHHLGHRTFFIWRDEKVTLCLRLGFPSRRVSMPHYADFQNTSTELLPTLYEMISFWIRLSQSVSFILKIASRCSFVHCIGRCYFF